MSYYLVSLGIPLLMVIPYYFFNRFLVKKINPRESGKKLILYFIVNLVAVFIYLSAAVFIIIWIAKSLP